MARIDTIIVTCKNNLCEAKVNISRINGQAPNPLPPCPECGFKTLDEFIMPSQKALDKLEVPPMIWHMDETDEITRRRLDNRDYDHYLNLDLGGVRIGNTGMVRWHIEQNGDIQYDEQYVADVLEKIIMVIRKNDATTEALEEENNEK